MLKGLAQAGPFFGQSVFNDDWRLLFGASMPSVFGTTPRRVMAAAQK
jgi:hypothetical protein